MITADASSLPGDTPEQIRCHIIVTADEGNEIASIEVLDRNGDSYFFDDVPDCTARYDHTISVPQRLLPISVKVRRCISLTAEPLFGPFFSPAPGVVPCDPSAGIPPTPDCARVLEEIRNLNRRIQENCSEIRQLSIHSIPEYTAAIAILHAVIVAALLAVAIASFFGPFGAAAAAVFTAVAGLAAANEAFWLGVLAVARIQLEYARREDRTLRISLGLFADEARRLCCPHEIATVDLSPRPCLP